MSGHEHIENVVISLRFQNEPPPLGESLRASEGLEGECGPGGFGANSGGSARWCTDVEAELRGAGSQLYLFLVCEQITPCLSVLLCKVRMTMLISAGSW